MSAAEVLMAGELTEFDRVVDEWRRMVSPLKVTVSANSEHALGVCPACGDGLLKIAQLAGKVSDLRPVAGCRCSEQDREDLPRMLGLDAETRTAAAHDRLLAQEVQRELRTLEARRLARELDDARRAPVALPGLTRLADFLDVDDEPVRYRITDLWPIGGRVVLSAAHKSGKSTMVANIVRALVDGVQFLERFDVAQAGRVVLVDDELDERMLRRWLRDQDIASSDRVDVLALRGRLSSFDILSPATRSAWARHLGSADVLILDCMRPILDALALSEDKDAGRFLEALDELTTEAGITETMVVHHTGHAGDRSRGDSRILDWPDAVWQLTREKAEGGGTQASAPRSFSAYGRDVDQAQLQLDYDHETRRLTTPGRRVEPLVMEASQFIIELLGEESGLSGRQILQRLTATGHTRAVLQKGLDLLIREGDVVVVEGKQRARLHYLAGSSETSEITVHQVPQECPSALVEECAADPLRGAHSGALSDKECPGALEEGDGRA